MADAANVFEDFSHITVRIECTKNDGSLSVGTGFFYSFLSSSGKEIIPLVVTNKHVIEGAATGRFVVNRQDAEGVFALKNHLTVEVDDFSKRWRHHPDEEVDLCAFPFAVVIKAAEHKGDKIFFRTLREENLITFEQSSKLSYFERIIMIGYPIGLWDHVNNRPIFRSGTTATHIHLDYCGRKEFLIDAACFPGSSGSPVIVFDTTRKPPVPGGPITIGGGIYRMAGILYAGPLHTTDGEIVIKDIPTVYAPIPRSMHTINLGYVIKASRILELEPLFAKKV